MANSEAYESKRREQVSHCKTAARSTAMVMRDSLFVFKETDLRDGSFSFECIEG
jgi:hypothetical protein